MAGGGEKCCATRISRERDTDGKRGTNDVDGRETASGARRKLGS